MDLIVNRIKNLPKQLLTILQIIGEKGDNSGINVFLVGGGVRDIAMGMNDFDVDIVVEDTGSGEKKNAAEEFSKLLQAVFGGTIVLYERFGTAKLVVKWPKWLGPSLNSDNKLKIDIATARKEKYKKPASLPEVKFSSLQQDLYRRDFTINAMAIQINRKHFGIFIDFFGGLNDLEKKTIKVLHDKSFIDDPTRIFRAVRFEQRFGFSIDKHTEYLIQHAVKQEMFHRTENQRIRDELILMLKEVNPETTVIRMKELHELRFIHPDLSLKRNVKQLFKDIRKVVSWYKRKAMRKRGLDVWVLNLFAMLDKLNDVEMEQVATKFVFSKSVSLRLSSAKECDKGVIKKLSGSRKMANSHIYKILEPLSHEVSLFLLAKTGSALARRRIKRFFAELNGVKLLISGSDLKKQGISPGPKYKDILKLVLYKKLDGRCKNKREEIMCMKRIVESFST